MAILQISTDVFKSIKSRKEIEDKAVQAAADLEVYLDKIVTAANITHIPPYNDYQLNVFKDDAGKKPDRLVLSYTRIVDVRAGDIKASSAETGVSDNDDIAPTDLQDITQLLPKSEFESKAKGLGDGRELMPVITGMMMIQHSAKPDPNFLIRPIAEVHLANFNPLHIDIETAVASSPQEGGMIMDAEHQERIANMIFHWVTSAMPEEHHQAFFKRCENFDLVPQKSAFGFQRPKLDIGNINAMPRLPH